MKKILFTAACAALLMSCASKRAAFVGSTITEAKTLKALANTENLPVDSATVLIEKAEKQNSDSQTEQAFVMADEAVLQIELSMLELENKKLQDENKKAADSLEVSKESLEIYQNVLHERKNAPKEQVIQ